MKDLEELLRESPEMGREDEEAFVDAIAEVIQRREKENPSGRLPDVEEALQEFQTHFNTPERDGMSLFPDEEDDVKGSKKLAARRKGVAFSFRNLAAAVLIVMCLAAILPAALGYENIFEMIGHWNDTLFHFVLSNQEANDPSDVEDYSSLEDALESNGATIAIAPKIPSEFELVAIEVTQFPEYKRIDYNAFYVNGERNISIYIVQRDEPAKTRSYEKDGTLMEVYKVNDIDHYIYENNGRVSITWYTDVFECSFRGDVSIEEAEILVNSIYEGV